MDQNLSQRAYSYIHEKLVSGQLAAGSRLSNRALAKEIGISFTPVREALNRLVSEGLLEYQRGLGVFVPTMTRRQIEEIYELRETLELAAVAKACQQPAEAGLAELERLLALMTGLVDELKCGEPGNRDPQLAERFRLADAAFHLALLRMAGNRLVLETVEGLHARSALIPHRFDREPSDQIERTHREHVALADAVRRRDAAAARAIKAEHLSHGRQQALAAFDAHYMDRGRRLPGGVAQTQAGA